MTELQKQLLAIVLDRGYLRLEEPVKLRSGELSLDFIDGKRALAKGSHLELACKALLDLVDAAGVRFDAVGGLTMGADQFAHGAAIVADCDWFVVRKEPKGRGTNKLIEGAHIGPGIRVLLVDDVVTTGGSIKQAYEEVNRTGATVVGAVTLVDRGDVASKWFDEIGVPYMPLLTYRDLDIVPVGGQSGAATAS